MDGRIDKAQKRAAWRRARVPALADPLFDDAP
jgi:hypothetical protein